jgi:hypothetical protein
MEAICSLLPIRPPARKSDPATDHGRWRVPALWAPAACLLNPKHAVDASSCPARPRTAPFDPRPRPARWGSSVSAAGKRGHAGAQRNGGSLWRAVPRRAHMAAHGGARSHERGYRKTSPVESSVCSLAGLAARPRPTSLLCVRSGSLFSFSPVPWELHVFGNLATGDRWIGWPCACAGQKARVPVPAAWRGRNHCSWIRANVFLVFFSLLRAIKRIFVAEAGSSCVPASNDGSYGVS